MPSLGRAICDPTFELNQRARCTSLRTPDPNWLWRDSFQRPGRRIKLLLEREAKITVVNSDGWTPVNAASSRGYVKVVKLLLEKGADITVANNHGVTPLISASSNGHTEVVELLLEAGAGNRVADNYGLTPLRATSETGRVDVVKVLIEKGSSITVTSGNLFKNKTEAERYQNPLYARRRFWSCSALSSYDRAFDKAISRPGEADTCGYCGIDFPRSGVALNRAWIITAQDWCDRIRHLQDMHKFGECNSFKKFYRADHFRQHIKHSHVGSSGNWTSIIENACMIEEGLRAQPAP